MITYTTPDDALAFAASRQRTSTPCGSLYDWHRRTASERARLAQEIREDRENAWQELLAEYTEEYRMEQQEEEQEMRRLSRARTEARKRLLNENVFLMSAPWDIISRGITAEAREALSTRRKEYAAIFNLTDDGLRRLYRVARKAASPRQLRDWEAMCQRVRRAVNAELLGLGSLIPPNPHLTLAASHAARKR
jgi:hypothetical protein